MMINNEPLNKYKNFSNSEIDEMTKEIIELVENEYKHNNNVNYDLCVRKIIEILEEKSKDDNTENRN